MKWYRVAISGRFCEQVDEQQNETSESGNQRPTTHSTIGTTNHEEAMCLCEVVDGYFALLDSCVDVWASRRFVLVSSFSQDQTMFGNERKEE